MTFGVIVGGRNSVNRQRNRAGGDGAAGVIATAGIERPAQLTVAINVLEVGPAGADEDVHIAGAEGEHRYAGISRGISRGTSQDYGTTICLIH